MYLIFENVTFISTDDSICESFSTDHIAKRVQLTFYLPSKHARQAPIPAPCDASPFVPMFTNLEKKWLSKARIYEKLELACEQNPLFRANSCSAIRSVDYHFAHTPESPSIVEQMWQFLRVQMELSRGEIARLILEASNAHDPLSDSDPILFSFLRQRAVSKLNRDDAFRNAKESKTIDRSHPIYKYFRTLRNRTRRLGKKCANRKQELKNPP